MKINSLPVRIILSFVALVILTAAAVGLPAIWLVRSQLDRQAWALVEQGSQTAQALHAARQSDLASLALLTAQRPTLRQLIQSGDQAGLLAYLHTLQAGTSLDLILVCSPAGQPLAQTGAIPAAVCQESGESHFYHQTGGDAPSIWLLSSQPVPSETGDLGKVIVGIALDDSFAGQMQEQTGLQQALLHDGRLVAASFDAQAADWQAGAAAGPPARRGSLLIAGQPYYTVRFPLGQAGLEDLVALPVADIAATQGQLTRAMALGILAVAAFGSALGMLLARRIGRPLADLGGVAVALRQGDLDTPVSVKTDLSEVAQVAYALEDARVALQHTLDDLRKEKEWIQHLLDSIVEGILTLDQHHRITFFSPGSERITGWKQEQVIGRDVDEIFPLAGASERFSQLLPPPGRRTRMVVALRGRRQATLAISRAELAPPEAGVARLALVMRDVSDEEALHRLLGDFLANISHEFRTPLSALAASIELLLDQLPDLSQGELQELLGALHLGILSLQTLIDNLLEGASIETGKFRVSPRPSGLKEMAEAAGRLMQPLLEKYGQRLALRLPDNLPPVLADPRRTGQVLANLLSNAAKYGPEGSDVILEAMQVEGAVRVTVADSGPGVAVEDQDELFRRFVHLDSASDRALYGAGLGLSVVKAIVEAQGGQVGVSNRPEGGAVFWFTLQLAPGEPQSAASSGDQERRP